MHERRPRLVSFNYVGIYWYFLTFCTHNRSSIFVSADIVHATLSHILHTAAQYGFAVIAYVFMPDHVHLLVEGLNETSDLREFVRIAKQKSGHAYKARHRRPLWQPSYYDHVLRNDDSIPGVIRYILENPVRRKLVTNHRDYPFIGSERYTLEDLEERARDAPEWRPRRQA